MAERARIKPELRLVELEPDKSLAAEFTELLAEAVREKRHKFNGPNRELIRIIHREDAETWGAALATLAPKLRQEIEAIANPQPAVAEAEKPPKGEAVLQQLLAEDCNLFRTADERAYADIMIKGHRETWAIRSTYFEKWLQHRFYKKLGGMPDERQFKRILAQAEAIALMEEDTPVRAVFLRVAGIEQGMPRETMFIDLCDADWRAIKITQKGWGVIPADELPEGVRFRRTPNMEALPEPDPKTEGLGNLLRERLNYKSESDYYLMVGWALNALRWTGQYPVLAIHGEQGSAKTTAMRVLRKAVDPQRAADRGLPKREEDLQIRAEHAHVISFDNLSRIPPDMSDAFCRMSTGGGSGGRTLYENSKETTFEATRPIILNGIADVIGKSDLAERTMRVELKVIDETDRKSEEAFWAAFEADRPKILAGLLAAMVEGLKNFGDDKPPKLGRMADSIIWAIKCEAGFTRKDGQFVEAYEASQNQMKADALAGDGVALAIQGLLQDIIDSPQREKVWQGSTEALRLELLREFSGKAAPRDFPPNATALAKRIKIAMPALRAAGVIIDDTKRDSRTKSPILLIKRKTD